MIELNDTMRERMAAGLSFLYTTRSGHVWYIDATLNFPFRQADFAECMYDAFDGSNFEPGFPDLSTCQYALEEGCPQWRGEGWYWVGNGDYDVDARWYGDIGALRDVVAAARTAWESGGSPWFADYGGNGREPRG